MTTQRGFIDNLQTRQMLYLQFSETRNGPRHRLVEQTDRHKFLHSFPTHDFGCISTIVYHPHRGMCLMRKCMFVVWCSLKFLWTQSCSRTRKYRMPFVMKVCVVKGSWVWSMNRQKFLNPSETNNFSFRFPNTSIIRFTTVRSAECARYWMPDATRLSQNVTSYVQWRC